MDMDVDQPELDRGSSGKKMEYYPITHQEVQEWNRVPTEYKKKMNEFVEALPVEDLRSLPFLSEECRQKLTTDKSYDTVTKLLGKFCMLNCQMEEMAEFLQEYGSNILLSKLVVQCLAYKTLLMFGWP